MYLKVALGNLMDFLVSIVSVIVSVSAKVDTVDIYSANADLIAGAKRQTDSKGKYCRQRVFKYAFHNYLLFVSSIYFTIYLRYIQVPKLIFYPSLPIFAGSHSPEPLEALDKMTAGCKARGKGYLRYGHIRQ